jgi:hypothetical protein
MCIIRADGGKWSKMSQSCAGYELWSERHGESGNANWKESPAKTSHYDHNEM